MRIPLNDTSKPVPLLLVDSTDHVTGETGQAAALLAALKVSKNGGALAAAAGTMLERSATDAPGLYYYTPTAGEVNTAGSLVLHAHGLAGIDPVDAAHEVEQAVADALDTRFDTLDTALGGVAAAVVTALKADDEWDALHELAGAKFVATYPGTFPGTGTVTFYAPDGTTVVRTDTITYDTNGRPTQRVSA
jgi:hypothetical protein